MVPGVRVKGIGAEEVPTLSITRDLAKMAKGNIDQGMETMRENCLISDRSWYPY